MIKRMTCRQSSGAYKTEFFVETFEEVAEQSKQNSMGMFQAKGAARIAAMKAMKAFPSMVSGRLLSYESDVVPSWDEGLLKWEREARDG